MTVTATNSTRREAKLCVALDVLSPEHALSLVNDLKGTVDMFKIGHDLYGEPHFVEKIVGMGTEIFLDLKYKDIPNTVRKDSRKAASQGVSLFNVHATGGIPMMQAALEGAREGSINSGKGRPLVVAVTILTSFDDKTFQETLHVQESLPEHVKHLARLAQTAGLDGAIASAREIPLLRDACGDDFLVITPGIRPTGTESHDQRRTMTPFQAVRSGADILVVGRPITQATDPLAAAQQIVLEMTAN